MKMAELARQTGISKNALSKLYYEKAQMIAFDTLDKICSALGCSVGELLERVEGPQGDREEATGE